MRVGNIAITKLFRVFDHTIPMNSEERITIIHGPNGFGKTVLLRLINGLFHRRFGDFRSIPFSEFRVAFDDGAELWVDRTQDLTEKRSKRRPPSIKLTVNYVKNESPAKSFVVTLPELQRDMEFPLSLIDREIPELDRVGATEWRYAPTGEILTLEEVVDRYSNQLPFQRFVRGPEVPDWFQDVTSSVPVRFIQTQRLISPSSGAPSAKYERQPSLIPAVNRYSEDLAGVIKSTLGEYAALSQSLDRSFPQRLVMQNASPTLAADALSIKLRDLEQKRTALMDIGLIDKEERETFQVPKRIDDTKMGVLSVYIQDVEEKLRMFDDVAARISLFSRIINDRFLYKKLTINRESGFAFHTSAGEFLPASNLSSGEQHELVLLYELLFKIAPNSLVLIDEPELSLHVAWQEAFLKDLQEITRLSQFDVLISTHSPQIISDKWDLTVELKRPMHEGIPN